jgi:hypothetical protein
LCKCLCSSPANWQIGNCQFTGRMWAENVQRNEDLAKRGRGWNISPDISCSVRRLGSLNMHHLSCAIFPHLEQRLHLRCVFLTCNRLSYISRKTLLKYGAQYISGFNALNCTHEVSIIYYHNIGRH